MTVAVNICPRDAPRVLNSTASFRRYRRVAVTTPADTKIAKIPTIKATQLNNVPTLSVILVKKAIMSATRIAGVSGNVRDKSLRKFSTMSGPAIGLVHIAPISLCGGGLENGEREELGNQGQAQHARHHVGWQPLL